MSEKPFDYYLPFTVIDFVMDEEFQAWVLLPTPERNAYWQALSLAFPQQRKNVREARSIIEQIRITDWQRPTPDQIQQSFRQLEARLDAPDTPVIRLHRRLWWRAAAATVLLVGSGLATYWYGFRPLTYQTAYGQIRTLTLPDQSVVCLGANTQLRLPGRWQFQSNRQVWLTGEAYFEIKKQLAASPAGKSNRQPFTVHTRQLDVQVLGTRFTVNTHRGRTSVLLDEGSVRLKEPAQTARTVVLRPGQLAQWETSRRRIAIKPAVSAPSQVVWKENTVVFRDASLFELSQRVQEVYGLTLVFDGPSWSDQTFTGKLPAQDSIMATRILTETFGGSAVRESNRIIFRTE